MDSRRFCNRADGQREDAQRGCHTNLEARGSRVVSEAAGGKSRSPHWYTVTKDGMQHCRATRLLAVSGRRPSYERLATGICTDELPRRISVVDTGASVTIARPDVAAGLPDRDPTPYPRIP
jgi:hypothetical protein